jgi:Transposase IS66 family
LRAQRGRLSPKSETAKAIDDMLRRWTSFARFIEDGRICLSNNAVGRRNWTFAGSDVGGHRAAALYTLIETCKLNEIDPPPGWLTFWRGCQSIRPSALTNSCPGPGKRRAVSRSLPDLRAFA